MKKILSIAIKKEIEEVIAKELDPAVFSLISVRNIAEAYAAIKTNKFSMILLSNVIPDMEDYREFCRALKTKADSARIPILLFGFVKEGQEAKIEALKNSLVSDYFEFPSPLEEILARLNIFIEIRMLQEELELKNILLKKLSITDDLTKTYNRRHLMERLMEEINGMKRYKYSVSCLMADIDHFKKINDTYGHSIGDNVLKQLGNLLKKNIRSVDILSRYGGEEFLIILPFTNKEGATIVGERLRSVIMSHDFTYGRNSLKVTVSIGAAAFTHTDSVDVNEVIKVVDKQLYNAKETGRNRVCSVLYSEAKNISHSKGISVNTN